MKKSRRGRGEFRESDRTAFEGFQTAFWRGRQQETAKDSALCREKGRKERKSEQLESGHAAKKEPAIGDLGRVKNEDEIAA
jgi:hypothetical protein